MKDPLRSAFAASWSVLEQSAARLTPGQVVELPVWRGVPAAHVALAVYGLWLERGGGGPLARCGRAALCGDAYALERSCASLYGGVVALTEPGPVDEALLQSAARHRVLLMAPSGQQPADAPPGWSQALAQRSELFGVAHDPDLESARLTLWARTERAAPVLLYGEAGSGAERLVAWLQAFKPELRYAITAPGDLADAAPRRPQAWVVFDVNHAGEPTLNRLASRCAPQRASGMSWSLLPPTSPGVERPADPAFAAIHTRSEAMAEAMLRLKRFALATSGLPVLIQGERGVGKELMARAFHELTGRSGPFVALDLGALEPNLARAELFGHTKGAFTGAQQARAGAFERAHGGTLFLDEVGNLSLDLQASLLRVLQERCVRPIGSNDELPIDVRVVSATNAPLELMAHRGEFRADLYSRLNAATLHLPALRQRPEDLEVLGEAFSPKTPEEEPWATPEARALLRRWHWPGNVRELRHAVAYASALAGERRPLRAPHFDQIAEALAPPGPTIVTHRGALEELTEALAPTLKRALTRAPLAMPSWRERSPLSQRFWLRALLDHRLVEPALLDHLAAMAWWGNLSELDEALKPLRQGGAEEALTVARARQLLPASSARAYRTPIRIMMMPVKTSRGVNGMIWRVEEAFALIGRARRLEELRARADEAPGGPYGPLVERLEGASLACVSLPWLPRLSRAHCLIERTPHQGLLLRHVGGASLTLWAGPIQGPLREVAPGGAVELDRAAQIVLRRSTQRLYAQLFVFEGEAAFQEHAPEALEHDLTERQGAALNETLLGDTAHGARRAPKTAAAQRPERVWALSRAEAETLTDIVAAYPGGRFSAHVRGAAKSLARRGVEARLGAYLERCSPRAAQYLGRLYAYEPNASLRELLRERCRATPACAERLPRPIRRALQP